MEFLLSHVTLLTVSSGFNLILPNLSSTLARGFISTDPNGQVQAGDSLYWNGSIAGFELVSSQRVSLNYIVL